MFIIVLDIALTFTVLYIINEAIKHTFDVNIAKVLWKFFVTDDSPKKVKSETKTNVEPKVKSKAKPNFRIQLKLDCGDSNKINILTPWDDVRDSIRISSLTVNCNRSLFETLFHKALDTYDTGCITTASTFKFKWVKSRVPNIAIDEEVINMLTKHHSEFEIETFKKSLAESFEYQRQSYMSKHFGG